ncbi:RNA polymerase sigma factor [Lentzea sp. NBRC 102530]|uniref:RNA polymerase sigma factor n=1 Tax=Lentzea sp. NBRC 102530 TaxID=3032201 RepID=UPI00255321D5|nr:RNA polymerase sigma factor [Lentzea sp. NBRC 102530]
MTSASTCPRTMCACPWDVRECLAPGVLDGDFVLFHDRHRVKFLKYLELRGVPPHDAEDIASDTFMALYRRREALRRAESPEAFAFKILRDALVDFWRRQGRRREHAAVLVDEGHAPDEVAGLETRLDLERLLACLPPRQAECLALFVLLDQDAAEIGRYLEIDASTVRSHLSDARRRFEEGGVR